MITVYKKELPSGFNYPFESIEIENLSKEECYDEFKKLISNKVDGAIVISKDSKLFDELKRYCREECIPIAMTESGLLSYDTRVVSPKVIYAPYLLQTTDTPTIGNFSDKQIKNIYRNLAVTKGEKP